MKYPWIDEYLLSKRGVTKDLQPDWNWIRYHVGGKMFAAILLDDDDQPYYSNLKLVPLEGQLMQQNYADIIPGYYSNKDHWNSVKADGCVPDDLLKTLLNRSYRLVLAGFSKQKQREILGLSCCGTDCAACPFYANKCPGCNACAGEVPHAPQGKPCPIYACCVNQHRFATCAYCKELPCDVWRDTRDPSLSEQAFEQSIADRVARLQE